MSSKEIKREYVEHKINEADAGVYAYDLALVEDLRERFKGSKINNEVNDTVQIGPTEQMFNIIGTLNEDKIIMPFISLERVDWQLNLDRQMQQTFVGEQVRTILDEQNKPVEVRMQIIPITVNWRLSVWTTDRMTNDAICRELLFYYHLRPTLMVKIGHGLNFEHTFNIYFNANIEDNSDIANHGTRGQYFRQDMTFYSDDCYLFKANYQHKVAISTDLFFDYGTAKDYTEMQQNHFLWEEHINYDKSSKYFK